MSASPNPSRPRTERRDRRRRSALVGLERLEARQMLATVSWVSDLSGSWFDPTRWSTGTVPAAGDDVVIDRGLAHPVVTFGGRDDAILSLTVKDTLEVSSGTLTVGANSRIDGALTLDGGNLGTSAGVLTLAGTTSWTSGDFSGGSVLNAGTMTLSGPGLKSIGGSLANMGTIADASTDPVNGYLDLGGTLDNRAGGIFDFQGDTSVYGSPAFGGSGVIDNAGTIRKSAGSGISYINTNVSLNNTGGAVDVRSGTIDLATKGSSLSTGGSFAVASGAVLDLSNSTGAVYTGTYTASGAGTILLSVGVIGAGTGGTFDFPAGMFQWTGGTIQGALTNAGSIGWAGGDLQGTLANTGSINLVGGKPQAIDYGASVINTGTIADATADPANGYLFVVGTLDNRAGGIFDFRGDGNIYGGTNFYGNRGTGIFKNAGTLRKSAGMGTSLINASVGLDNLGGTIDVESGTLHLGTEVTGVSTGGHFVVAAGSVLDLTSDNAPVYTGTYTGSGAGAILLGPGGILDADAGGTFDFPAGMFHWTGGVIKGVLTNAGTLNLSGNNGKVLKLNSTLINTGTIVDTSTDPVNGYFDVGGVLDNRAGGVVDLRSDSVISGYGINGDPNPPGVAIFKNAGTLRKSAGTSSTIASQVSFDDLGGTVDVESGTLSVYENGSAVSTGGTFTVAKGSTLDLTNASGTGAIFSGTYTGAGAGTVELIAGVLNTGSGATLDFSSGPFRWSGGTINGPLTNDGSMTLTGSSGLYFYGTLNNAGTIADYATFYGLDLAGDLNNLAGGVFVFQGPVQPIQDISAGKTSAFTNAGTVRVASGVNGTIGIAFHNTGTVTLDPGQATALNLPVTAAALTGGTYTVGVGATLTLSDPVPITENDASVILDGTGASIPQLAPLVANKGSLSVLHGAKFTTAGDLSNSGTIAVGAGSVVAVAGNFTQSAGGTTSSELDSTATGPVAGSVQVKDVATLGGTLALTLAPGFGPAIGQSFRPVTYAAHTGTFATVTGLVVGGVPFFKSSTGADAVTIDTVSGGSDLAAVGIVAPTGSSSIGEAVTVHYTVKDLSLTPAPGTWTDSVYLSADGKIGPDAVLLGRSLHTGGLAGASSYEGTVTGALPALSLDHYHVVVVVDSRDQVLDVNRSNNVATSPGTFGEVVPALTDYASITGTVADGQDLVFRLEAAAGSSQVITLAGGPGIALLAIRRGDVPTLADFDQLGNSSGPAGQQLATTVPQGGVTEYILVHGQPGAPGASRTFTLSAAGPSLQAYSAGPNAVARYGNSTITIHGAGFTPTTTLEIDPVGEAPVRPTSLIFVDGGTLVATFAFRIGTGAAYHRPPTKADLLVTDAGRTSTLAGGLSLLDVVDPAFFSSKAAPLPPSPAGLPNVVYPENPLVLKLSAPAVVRTGSIFNITIDYTNPLPYDAPAQLINISSFNGSFRLPGQRDFQPGNLFLLAVNQEGTPGMLPPGYHGEFTIEVHQLVPTANTPSDFALSYMPLLEHFRPSISFFGKGSGGGVSTIKPDPTRLIDRPILFPWDLFKPGLKPSGVTDAAWEIIFANLVGNLGTTTASVLAGLTQDANYLAGLGEKVVDISELLAFEVQRAGDFGEIARRFTPGALGYGQAYIADTRLYVRSLTVDPTTKDVTVRDGPSSQVFQPETMGQFKNLSGGPSGLFFLNGVYKVTDHGGKLTEFNRDGTLHAVSNPDFTQPNALDVTVQVGSTAEVFLAQAGGGYLAGPGLHSTLSLIGGVYQLRDASGVVTTFNPDGTIHEITHPDGTYLTAGYAAGRLTTLTDSLREVATYTYDANGRITRIVDPFGRATTFGYDSTDTLLTSVTGPGGTTTFGYQITGAAKYAVTQVQFPGGSGQYFAYDAKGRLLFKQGNGGANPLAFTYDTRPGAVVSTDKNGAATTSLVNQFGIIARVIDPLGHVSSTGFDTLDQPTSGTDALGNLTAATYDASGNVTSIVDPLGGRTRLTYDPTFNAPTSLRDPNGNVTRFATNGLGQPTGTTYADGTTQVFTYHASGNIATAIDRNGQTTTLSYGPHAQVAGASHGDGTSESYTYDAHGNILTATNANGTTTSSYDSADRLIRISYPSGLSLTYAYDTQGRRSRISDGTGYVVYGTYDAEGRLASETDGAGRLIVAYAYDQNGRLARKALGNGTATDYAYNAAGRLVTITNTNASVVISRYAYTYDAAGRPLTATSADGTTRYAYNADGQITSVALPAGRTLTYHYDSVGNRISSTDSGVMTTSAFNNLDESTAAGSTTFTYDHAGRLTSKTDGSGTTTYAYDLMGHLTQAVTPGLGTFQYLYDALGHRIATIHDGQRTDDLVDPSGIGSIVGRFVAGKAINHYTYGLDLTSQVDGSGASDYYNFDAAGNTTDLTGPSGAVLDRYAYLPFGESLKATGPTANPFTFVGSFGVSSEATGLVYMRNRWYDPSSGRFTTPDPLGFGGGDVNLYRYAGNSPTSAVDPIGLSPFSGLIPALKADLSTKNILKFSPSSLALGVVNTSGLNFIKDYYGWSYANTSLQNQALDNTISAIGASYYGAPLLASIYAGTFVGAQIRKIPGVDYVATAIDRGFLIVLGVDEPQHIFTSAARARLLDEDPQIPLYVLAKVGVLPLDAHDPNAITGPSGFGATGFVPAGSTFPYRIDFVNEPMAGAAAAVVTVTETLDPSLDWTTFQLGAIHFGGITVSVPEGLTTYRTRVDARSALGVYVDVVAEFNTVTGVATWTLTALSPTTLDLLSDPALGVLPPDNASGRGEGSVSYTVRPKAAVTTGTVIHASASVVFDAEPSLNTPTIANTIDAGSPTSQVSPIPAITAPSFTISWTGGDDAHGSGIAFFDLYESMDGGPLISVATGLSITSLVVNVTAGHNYGFAVIAHDNVGHIQALPATAQAATTSVTPGPVITLNPIAPVLVGATLTAGGKIADPFPGTFSATVDFGDASRFVGLSPGPGGIFAFSHVYEHPGIYHLLVGVIDAAGAAGRQTIDVTVAAPFKKPPVTPIPVPTPTPTPTPVPNPTPTPTPTPVPTPTPTPVPIPTPAPVPTPTPAPVPTPTPTHVGLMSPADTPIESGRVAFVSTLYRDILGRTEDVGGLSSWVTKLAAGIEPIEVVADFFRSPERQTLRHQHRAPRITPSKALSDALHAEAILEGLEPSPAVAAEVASVMTLYVELLGRNPDAAGLDHWLERLDSGAKLSTVAEQIDRSTESKSFNAAHKASRITESRAFADAKKAARSVIILGAKKPTGLFR